MGQATAIVADGQDAMVRRSARQKRRFSREASASRSPAAPQKLDLNDGVCVTDCSVRWHAGPFPGVWALRFWLSAWLLAVSAASIVDAKPWHRRGMTRTSSPGVKQEAGRQLVPPLSGGMLRRAQAMSTQCPIPQDIILLCDSSYSVGSASNFTKMKEFAQNFLRAFAIPPVRAAVVRFMDFTTEISGLEEDSGEIFGKIISMKFEPGGRELGPPLQNARSILARRNSATVVSSVLVMTNGLPDDEAQAKSQATLLQQDGAQLLFLVIGGTTNVANMIDLYSEMAYPTGGKNNVFIATSFDKLSTMLSAVEMTVKLPCPCRTGTKIFLLGPRDLTAIINTSLPLRHGAAEVKDCEQYFPGHSGIINLTCSNGKLLPTYTCALFCPKAVQAKVAVGDLVGLAKTTGRLDSGVSEKVPCQDVMPGSDGTVSLECIDGAVTASHTCAIRCPGGDMTAIALDRVGNISLPVQLPSTGLDSGLWMQRQCTEDLGGALGSQTIMCIQGQPRLFGHCIETPTCSQDGKDFTSPETLAPMIALGVVALLCLCIGLVLCLVAVFCQQRRSQPVEPEKLSAVLPVHPDSPSPAPVVRAFDAQTPQRRNVDTPVQTLPQVYAELVRGCQLSMDMILCVESSYSTGESGFRTSVEFMLHIVQALELPPIQLGIVQFNHGLVPSELVANRGEIEQNLAGMLFEGGENKLGPALHHAGTMLAASESQTTLYGEQPRKKTVVVLLDSEPIDFAASDMEAGVLKQQGVQLLFVVMGTMVNNKVVSRLASAPADDHVVRLPNYNYDLVAASASVLERVVDVSMWVRKAKCIVNLLNYQEVPDIACVKGYDLMVPGWEEKGGCVWSWEPRDGVCLPDPQIVSWQRDYQPLQLQTRLPTDFQHCKPLEDYPSPRPPPQPRGCSEVQVQTDPVVKVNMEASGQASLDLVICVNILWSPACDKPPSIRNKDQTIGNLGPMEHAKAFVENLVSCIHMPEARLALVFFQEECQVLCPLTGDRGTFKEKLSSMEPLPGKVRFAPPLRKALALLNEATAPRAVLVVTDANLHDIEDAMTVVSELREAHAQLLFVRIAKTGNHSDGAFHKLAMAGHRLPMLGNAVADLRQPTNVFDCEDSSMDALADLASDVMRQILKFPMRVTRARCTIPLSPFQMVQDDLGGVEGQDILLAEGMPMVYMNSVAREEWMPPKVSRKELPAKPERCIEATEGHMKSLPSKTCALMTSSVQTEAEMSTMSSLGALGSSVQTGKMSSSCSSVQTETPQSNLSLSEVQTDSLVHLSLSPWRHAPLDLVICVDSAASFCLTRQAPEVGGMFVQSGTFERAKNFIENLASSMHMPEVRLGLVRMEDEQRLSCGLTSNFEEFRERLAAIEPSAGQSKFAPSLWHARELLQASSSEHIAERSSLLQGTGAQLASAVLVITDSDPHECARWEDTQRAASAMHSDGVQILCVKLTPEGQDACLSRSEAAAAPWTTLFTSDSEEALQSLIPEVLSRLVRVTQRIAKASCTLDLQPHLNADAKYDVHLPEDSPLLVTELVPWDGSQCQQSLVVPTLPAYYEREMHSLQEEVKLLRQQLQQDNATVEEEKARTATAVEGARRAAAGEQAAITRLVEAESRQAAAEKARYVAIAAEAEAQRRADTMIAEAEERAMLADGRATASAVEAENYVAEAQKAAERRVKDTEEEMQRRVALVEEEAENRIKAIKEESLCRAANGDDEIHRLRQFMERREEERRAVDEERKRVDDQRRAADEERRSAEELRRQEQAEHLRLLTQRYEEERNASDAERRKMEEERRTAEAEYLKSMAAKHEEERQAAREERRAAEAERAAAERARIDEYHAAIREAMSRAEGAEQKLQNLEKAAAEAERERDTQVRESRDLQRRSRDLEDKISELTRTVGSLRADIAQREADNGLREAEMRASASEMRAIRATAERRAEVLQLRLEQAELEVQSLKGTNFDWRLIGNRGLVDDVALPESSQELGSEVLDSTDRASMGNIPSAILKQLDESGSSLGVANEPQAEPSANSALMLPKRPNSRANGNFIWRSADLTDCMEWVRARLEEREGSINQAFHLIDNNKTGRITCAQTITALEMYAGLSKSTATHVFRRLTQLASCERRGCLTLQDWNSAFHQVKAVQDMAGLSLMPPMNGKALEGPCVHSAHYPEDMVKDVGDEDGMPAVDR